MDVHSFAQKANLPNKKKWITICMIIGMMLMILVMHFKKNSMTHEDNPSPPVVLQKKPAKVAKIPPIRWVQNHKLSVDLDNIPMAEALGMLAQFMHLNMVVNPSIHKKISLHWHSVEAEGVLESLIRSQNLKSWQENRIWYVTTQEEWRQHQEEEQKMQKMLNETAALQTRVWQIHFARAEDIAKILQDSHHSLLSKRGTVRVDNRTNILCIQDLASHIPEIDRLIGRLDVPVQQVLIEAHLASIDNDYEKELGIQLGIGASENEGGFHVGPYSLAVATLADGSLLNMRLAALESEGHAELISSPILFTANLKTASIESGEEIPYQETNVSGATSVTFKKAVLSLKVTPQIMSGGNILLELQVNQDKPSNRIILGVPAINTRQINTHIMIKDGQTIILGGIYETDRENVLQRNPILDKIPLVGSLLSQQNGVQRKRELLIFVTPKIIH